MHIAYMSSVDPAIIQDRVKAIKASYLRQLGLAGKPGYDPQLTIQLKQDLDWLQNQIQEPGTSSEQLTHTA
jgi:hypothetical protein